LDKKDLERISRAIKKEGSLFSKKAYLENLTLPSQIIGREEKAEELARYLLAYQQGLVVPLISVYGRSGSGKTTVTKFVCENLDSSKIFCCFVNLRKAKTIFGCANLILAELGEPNVKSAQGLNSAIENIENAIESVMKNRNPELFVLVLDEFDVLFYDKRGKPSDFIYKLLVMEERLRDKRYMATTIVISNNIMSEYELDDRVRSRMGSSEIFFNAYTKQDVLDILEDRAMEAFSQPIKHRVLDYCAELSSQEHGDARRAIDLLRVAVEIAGSEKTVTKKHVDMASWQLQTSKVDTMLSGSSHHLKVVCFAIARLTLLTGESWHATSTIYNQYQKLLPFSRAYYYDKRDMGADEEEGGEADNSSYNNYDSEFTNNPLSYRRVSELLTELENSGILVSHTSSAGRHGYGTQYKLRIPPGAIGLACFPKWWARIVMRKKAHDHEQKAKPTGSLLGLDDIFETELKEWDKYVGLEEE
jgi:archaeal cell division control protein 6